MTYAEEGESIHMLYVLYVRVFVLSSYYVWFLIILVYVYLSIKTRQKTQSNKLRINPFALS